MEDELARLRVEIDTMESVHRHGGEEREAHLASLVRALVRGGVLDRFDPSDVAMVREAMDRYEDAARRVAERVASKGL